MNDNPHLTFQEGYQQGWNDAVNKLTGQSPDEPFSQQEFITQHLLQAQAMPQAQDAQAMGMRRLAEQ